MGDSAFKFSSWLASSSWWLALILVGLLALSIVLILATSKGKGKPAKKLAEQSVYLSCLGGSENVIDKKLVGSRISITLKDTSLVDQDKLKEAGVDASILMSNKLTLVAKGEAKELYLILFGEEA